MEDSILLSAPCGTLGTLYLVKRKDGEDLQSFPIDAQKVSIGRDYDCDIRLYFSDVSKLHCEITFDLATGQASLHVLGGNGLFHTPADGATKQHKPPSVILLNDRDTFVIRKKVFRFEYPTDNISPEIAGLMSPVVIPSSLPSASPSPVKNWPPNEPSVRRRASHRLSLVPFGQRFVPMSPAKGRRHSTLGLGRMGTPSKSTLNREVTEEEAEEEDDAQEKQEDLVVDVVNGEEGDMVYLEVNEEAIDQPRPSIQLRGFMTPQPAGKAPLRNTSVVPRTRVLASSIPDRPAMIDFEVETAVKPTEIEDTASKSASDPVPAQVAMTTPRGSSSLRKSLLLRSVRKAWEENRSPGIDGAIESGAVEVRRKSSSPKYMNRRSLTPGNSPVIGIGAGQAEHDGSEEGESPSGAVNTSSSSSEMDSFAADVSLDIETDNHALQVEEEALAPGNWMEIDESMNEEQISMEVADISSSSLEEDPIADSTNESFDFGGNQELRQNDSARGKTTANMSDINQRFYTPQPQRIATFQPRRSLANIGGPAVRFERLPSTPQSVPSRSIHRTVPTPGTLGKPARLAVQSVKEEEEEETVLSTPARARPSPAVVAEAKRRRETLATPRALPVPPASGFKERIRDTPIGASLVKSTSHPALAFASPESSLDVPAIPSTPMDHLKQRMADLRRQSLNRQTTAIRDGQRATVGFALPSTPAQSHTTPSRTQTFNIAATPSFRGMREMLKTPGAAKTPYMRDLKDLFPTTIEEQPTPSLVGVKDMLQEEKRPATPDMGGVRSLFHERLYPKTPAMEGMAEMYELVETEDEGTVVSESDRLLKDGQEEHSPHSPRTRLSNASSTLSHRARGVPRGTNKTVPATAQSAPSRIPLRKRKDDTAPVQDSKTSAIKISASASRANKANSSKSSEDPTEAVSSHVEGETVNESASGTARSGRAIRATTRSATNMLSESVQVEVPKRGRPRKILNESQSQESGTVPEQSTVSTNIASKRSHASASSRKAAASNEGAGKSQSAPTRRTRTAAKTQSAEKENEPETQRVDDAPRKRSSASTTRKTASSARETVSAPARSTRSRK